MLGSNGAQKSANFDLQILGHHLNLAWGHHLDLWTVTCAGSASRSGLGAEDRRLTSSLEEYVMALHGGMRMPTWVMSRQWRSWRNAWIALWQGDCLHGWLQEAMCNIYIWLITCHGDVQRLHMVAGVGMKQHLHTDGFRVKVQHLLMAAGVGMKQHLHMDGFLVTASATCSYGCWHGNGASSTHGFLVIPKCNICIWLLAWEWLNINIWLLSWHPVAMLGWHGYRLLARMCRGGLHTETTNRLSCLQRQNVARASY